MISSQDGKEDPKSSVGGLQDRVEELPESRTVELSTASKQQPQISLQTASKQPQLCLQTTSKEHPEISLQTASKQGTTLLPGRPTEEGRQTPESGDADLEDEATDEQTSSAATTTTTANETTEITASSQDVFPL